MLEVVSWFIICFITSCVDYYLFSKLINSKYKISKKMGILILMQSLISTYVMSFSSILIRSLIINTFLLITLYIYYKISLTKTLIGTLFIYFGYAISEVIFVIIFVTLLGIDSKFLLETNEGFLISNISMLIFIILMFQIKSIVNFGNKVINWYKENDYINALVLMILSVIVIISLMYPNDVVQTSYLKNFFNSVMIIGFLLLMMNFFKEKTTNNQLTVKYDELLEYVKDYEVEVVEKGKAIHEHKNQLAVIDGMIPKTNKKLKKYVDEKLENLSKLDDNVWLEKLTNLPMGGIKGLVYLKIKKMLDNNISIYVEIDDDLKNKNKWKSINNNLEDYTKILGVYLDNAIEAAIDSKDKQIIIEFVDNKDNLEFILSNTYKGKINFEEIYKEKFSTKGNGRGYGLSLVKDIIDKNKYIDQSREINGKFYVQKLTIKK